MASSVDIYNMALQEVGAKRVSTISDESKGAQAIFAIWDGARDSVLSEFKWNFAIEQAELVKTTDPEFGYECAYTLPADCLKVLEMSPAGYKYRVAGATFETDLDSALGTGYEVKVEYIKQITDTTLWSPLFVTALSLYIAKSICIAMTGRANIAGFLENKYAAAISKAQGNDWQQDNELAPGQPDPARKTWFESMS